MQTLAPYGFVRYLYAPKGDAALRRNWRAPFTSAWRSQLLEFRDACRKQGVALGIGLSPCGLHENFTAEWRHDYARKLEEIKSLELDCVGILFDDFERGHGDIVAAQREIVQCAVEMQVAPHLIVCPSYYSDDIVLDRVFGERPADYLHGLCANLAPDVEVFWTGEEVCARQFDKSHLTRIASQMGRKPTLWDNYPVNDGPRMSERLHLRAFTGRSHQIAGSIAAHYINPALQPMLTLIPAITLAMSYERGDEYAYAQAFSDAAETVVGRSLARALREDLLALQDVGRLQLGPERSDQLRDRYRQYGHPAAMEIIGWLDGKYRVSADDVKTQ